jgi:hypothetical protein
MDMGIEELESAQSFQRANESVQRHAELLNTYVLSLDPTISCKLRERLTLLYAHFLYSRLIGDPPTDES